MMGLAWDSLWHAIITPQQAADQAGRDVLVMAAKIQDASYRCNRKQPKYGSIELSDGVCSGIDPELCLWFKRHTPHLVGYDPDQSEVSL